MIDDEGRCHPLDRQLLGEVTHVDKHLPDAGVDARAMSITLPLVIADKSSREVWCPRLGRGTGKSHALRTRLPEWNGEIGSLVMKFIGRRVVDASSKNILMVQSEDMPVFQFGKSKSKVYNLDYKYPLCPLQAFGAALSLFAWKKKDAK